MILSAGTKKLALTVHVAISVGWLGAVVAYLSVAVTGRLTADPVTARSAYLALEMIARAVIVPASLLSLLSGLLLAVGTPWGVVRHRWVITKWALTLLATAVLFGHLRAISSMAALAAAPTFEPPGSTLLRTQLVIHAAAALAVLLFITGVSIYKPWGRTRYGRGAGGQR